MKNIVIIAFGRFNPISVGHKKMAKFMKQKADELNGQALVYLSHSYDGKDSGKFKLKKCKNPLPYDKKLQFVRDALDQFVTIIESDAINIYQALHECYEQGFTEAYVISGDDRLEDYDILKSYNGYKGDESKYFKFKKLEIISAGVRDESSNDPTEQASASLLRQCVKDLNYDRFEQFAGTETLTEEMYDELLFQMGIELN